MTTFTQGGVAYLLRDKFTTAQNPLVDGNASEGSGVGYRDVYGSGFYAAANRLRGGNTSEGKIVYKPDSGTSGFSRTGGRTFCALVTPDDGDGNTSLWLAENAGTLDGYGIQFTAKTVNIIEPDGNTVRALVVDGNPGRAMQYLVGITLNESRGAVYWISAMAAYTPTNEWPIPAYPSARILFVSTLGTASTYHPTLRASSGFSYPGGVAFEDVRLFDVPSWAGADALALYADRFDRADNASSLGGSWSAGASSVWGVNGNQAYCSSSTFNGRAVVNAGTADVWVVAEVTSGTSLSDWFGLCLRQTGPTATTFMRCYNNGSANIYLQKFLNNSYNGQVFATYAAFTTSQMKRWLVGCNGNQFRVFLNGDETTIQPTTDSDGNHTSGTYFGLFGDSNSGQRWDYFAVYGLTISLPDDFDSGAYPALYPTFYSIASDTFTDTDGTTLNAHNSSWLTDGGTWTIQSNAAQGAGSSGALRAYQDTGKTAVQAVVDVIMPATVNLIRAGFTLRRADGSNMLHVRCFVDDGTQLNNDEIEIQETIGGGAAVVRKCYLGNFFATGTTYTLKIQVVGDVLHVLLNDIPHLTHLLSDAALQSGGGFGLYREGGSNNATFDNLVLTSLSDVTVLLTDFPTVGLRYEGPIIGGGDPVIF